MLFLAPEGAGEASVDGVRFAGRAALVRRARSVPTAVCAYGLTSLTAPGIQLSADAPSYAGKIVACHYDRSAIVVAGVPASGNLVGQHVRIHNDMRSTMPRLTGVAARDDGTELTLSTTALRHEGWVAGVSAGTLRDGAPSPWALDTFLRGTRLVNEKGDREWIVSGAAGGWHSAPTGTRISLLPAANSPVSALGLRDSLTDANGNGTVSFAIYEYGAGDQVGVANFMSVARQPDRAWREATSSGVHAIGASSR